MSFFFLLFLFLFGLWSGICAEVDVDRIGILPPPTPFFFPLPTNLCLTQVTVI